MNASLFIELMENLNTINIVTSFIGRRYFINIEILCTFLSFFFYFVFLPLEKGRDFFNCYSGQRIFLGPNGHLGTIKISETGHLATFVTNKILLKNEVGQMGTKITKNILLTVW